MIEHIPISAVPLFQDLSQRSLQIISEATRRHYEDGEVIFHKGEHSTEMLVLLHGQVRVEVDDVLIVTCPPYEVIGEQAVIDGEPHSGTVRAQGLVEVLALNRDLLAELAQDSTFTRNLLALVSAKLREATAERAYRYKRELLLFTEFKAHVSPNVLNALLSSGKNYGEPHFINAVILYSDIRDFTSRSSEMSPQTIAEQLTLYLDAVVDVIHRHDGMVDKFTGDAVLAIWGYSASSSDYVLQALDCAEEMLSAAGGLPFGGEPIHIGVGLNAGNVFIGNVGGAEKRQFTVLGMPVNLAARYESATKELGVSIVAGEDFVERLPEERKSQFTSRQIEVKGVGLQTVYLHSSPSLQSQTSP